MSFVFYDTETTGTSTEFDQILQFAAIKTDTDLNVVEELEVRCRLLPHVIPHPGALRVTGMTIDRITHPENKSHYEMVREVRTKLMEWSPAIFVGYNSFGFDEHLLRQALFQTLHPAYLTNTNNNCRADALALVQAASVFVPDCLNVPKNPKGGAIFKLDRLAPSNGFSHANAHDALADVHATIHVARCVKERAPEVWNRFVRFSKKAVAADFIQDEDGFLLTEFYFNRPYHYVVGFFGLRPGRENASLCLDLSVDLDHLTALSDSELITLVRRSPKPIRQIRTNAAPSLTPLDEADEGLLGGVSVEELSERARRLRDDDDLRARLVAAFVASQGEEEASHHFEQRIYESFPSPADQDRMAAFHDAEWADRAAIVEAFEDDRLRFFGRKLLYAERPELLHESHHSEVAAAMRARMTATESAGWTTLGVALAETTKFLALGIESESELLLGYRDYLLNLEAQITAT